MKNSEIVEMLRSLAAIADNETPSWMKQPGRPIAARIAEARRIASELEAAALPPNPDVRSIVRAYLEADGYDGLCTHNDSCGCDMRGELLPVHRAGQTGG